jgi:glycosyltransferase involved in cell wall biosynthesis
MKRVLIVSLAAAVGGAERSMLLLAETLPGRGWAPVLACPPGELADRARAAGIEVGPTPWAAVGAISGPETAGAPWSGYRPLAMAGAAGASVANAVRTATLARRHRADVILSNSLHAHPFVTAGARLARRPAVWHLRDIVDPGPGRRVLGLLAKASAGVVAVSEPVADTVAGTRVTVVANPIRLTTPAPVDRGPEPVVGFLGRLDPEKGVEDLIRAAARVPARFVLAGAPVFAPEGYPELLVRLAERDAPGKVTFAGPVAEPEQALAGFDVLAVPSHREPWGRVAAEALTLGVPVVAADAGGLPEVVRDGVDGLLHRPRDVGHLAAQLTRLVTDEALRKELGAAAAEGAVRFGPDTHAAAVAAVLDRVAPR